MSQAGAKAQRTALVQREFDKHAKEISEKVAGAFQPVYERVCRERGAAIERAAILQTVVERIALGRTVFAVTDEEWADGAALSALAQGALDQLGIVPDVQVEPVEVEEPTS